MHLRQRKSQQGKRNREKQRKEWKGGMDFREGAETVSRGDVNRHGIPERKVMRDTTIQANI